jgi:uncharacterized repeat protein (TIGR03803 family)
MQVSNSARYAFVACATIVLLADCSGSQPAFSPSGMQGAGSSAFGRDLATSYKVLFNFASGDVGYDPAAGLTDVSGTLYGTTEGGGEYRFGTVFSLTTSGRERVLHNFGGAHAGFPVAGLTELNGLLYGTTIGNGGIVFSLKTTGGKKRLVYAFKRAPDGDSPYAGLTALNGTLYGTTVFGGSGNCYQGSGCGTVFSVTTAGKERVLHSFKDAPDGALPDADLTVLNGRLYGTTENGGSECDGSLECGTVFSITTGGKERVLYSFKGGPDGRAPYGGLTALNGTLYGTTSRDGGAFGGTVFSVTTGGKERVLYSFKALPDGSSPMADLIALNGTLYGTTENGGSQNCTVGCGTVFSVTTAGKERVLHSFKGVPDGAYPYAGLTALSGRLYGTTYNGGTHNVGTAFALTP